MELTEENVVKILEELAPYVEADGGFLEFVEIDHNPDESVRSYYGVEEGSGGVVKVRLGGACETCAMSAVTLRQGIEKKVMSEIPSCIGVIQVL